MRRRAFLGGCGAITAGATAGCLGSVPLLGNDGGIDTSSPRAVVESYVETVAASSGLPDSAEEMFHSTVVDNTRIGDGVDREPPGDFESSLVEMQGPAVALRGLSESQLRSLSQSWRVLAQEFTPPDGFVSELAAGETALVDVRFTFKTTFEGESGTQTSEFTRDIRVTTAVEDGDWQIVSSTIVGGPGSG